MTRIPRYRHRRTRINLVHRISRTRNRIHRSRIRKYTIIWLLKDSVDDPEHILPGGTFQVLSEDKSEVLIDNFTMNGTWQEWDVVLKADHTYWLHEVTPPDGYTAAEDVKFTVSHYGESMEVPMNRMKEPK